MKGFPSLFIVLLLVSSFIFFRCSKDTVSEDFKSGKLDFDTLVFNHSMKGWELYSWTEGKTWVYSVLPGTNRLKTKEEVIANTIKVCGTDSLKMLLGKFPEDEYIAWIGERWLFQCWGNNDGNFSLPGQKTIDEIKEYCLKRKLNLGISE